MEAPRGQWAKGLLSFCVSRHPSPQWVECLERTQCAPLRVGTALLLPHLPRPKKGLPRPATPGLCRWALCCSHATTESLQTRANTCLAPLIQHPCLFSTACRCASGRGLGERQRRKNQIGGSDISEKASDGIKEIRGSPLHSSRCCPPCQDERLIEFRRKSCNSMTANACTRKKQCFKVFHCPLALSPQR